MRRVYTAAGTLFFLPFQLLSSSSRTSTLSGKSSEAPYSTKSTDSRYLASSYAQQPSRLADASLLLLLVLVHYKSSKQTHGKENHFCEALRSAKVSSTAHTSYLF